MTVKTIKQKIKNNFNKATITYDNVCSVQRQSACYLIEEFKKKYENFYPKIILDVGCGTGNITDETLKYYPRSKYYLNDISDNMIGFVKKKYNLKNNFSFITGDIEGDVIDNNHYDLIISNLAIQWVDNLEVILNKFIQQSCYFACSFLLDGTFLEWKNYLLYYGIEGVIKSYPTLTEIKNITSNFTNSEINIFEKDFVINFNNPLEVMKYLNNLGANTSNAPYNTTKIKKILLNNKKPCKLSYRVGFLIIKK